MPYLFLIFFDKLMVVSWLVNKYYAFFMEPDDLFLCPWTILPSLDYILSQLNPVSAHILFF
jgi:hypothetical protein